MLPGKDTMRQGIADAVAAASSGGGLHAIRIIVIVVIIAAVVLAIRFIRHAPRRLPRPRPRRRRGGDAGDMRNGG
jgi:hypothetical protein